MNKVLLFTGVVCLAIMGCQPLLDSVTPTRIPNSAEIYLNKEIGKENWTSLQTADDILNEITFQHRDVQLDLHRLIDDDKYSAERAIAGMNLSITTAQTWQERIVGSLDNPNSLFGILAAAGLFTGGLFTKKPGTFSKQQVEEIVIKRLIEKADTNTPDTPDATV